MSERKKTRDIYRLVNDVCQFGHDPQAWTGRLMRGLRQLFDARVAALVSTSIPQPGGDDQQVQVLLYDGFTPEQERTWNKQFYGDGQTFRSEYLRRMVSIPARFVTVTRQDVMSDEEFYALPEGRVACPACDVDQHMNSWFIALSLHRMFAMAVHRAWGEPRFSKQDRHDFRLLHLELARAWRERIAGENDKDAVIGRLSARLRQVLWLLCLGRSEKEIAAQLQLSPHTVHNHVTRLHQELAVNSRGELLARALTGGRTPQVAIPPTTMNQFRPF